MTLLSAHKPILIGLLDVPRLPDSAWHVLPFMEAYTDALLLRYKPASPDQLWQVAERVRRIVPHMPLWINGPLEVAMAVHAEGWHLPAGQMAAEKARPHWPGLLTGSVHNLDEVKHHHGADLLIWGHAFHSRSKLGFLPRRGLDGIIAATTIPVLAIGGITATNISRLSHSHLRGVVVADGLWMATDPIAAAQALCRAMGQPPW